MPFLAISSSWLPCSDILPLSNTKITSASFAEASLWLIKIVVKPWLIDSNWAYTWLSATGSKAAVGSSNILMGEGLTIALANASLCHSPPDRSMLASWVLPNNVSLEWLLKPDLSRALSISSSVDPLIFPIATLSATLMS